jgi:hypothetical protein
MTLFVEPLKQFLSNFLKESVSRLTTRTSAGEEETLVQEFKTVFDRGQDVVFGALTLSQEGINLADSIIPWSALRSFRCEKNEVILVRQVGNRFESHRVAIGKVRHLAILIQFLSQYSQVKLHSLAH